MFVYFLLEDMSSGVLIDILMEKFVARYPNASYKSHSFKGLGGFTKKNTVKETRTGKLLDDLATYLRGFNKSLQYQPDAAVFVVLDNDDNDPVAFRAKLEKVADDNDITIDHVFCIAIEEMEAWLLGDREALQEAYPCAKMQKLKEYEQDSICAVHGKYLLMWSIPKASSSSRRTFRPLWKWAGRKANGRSRLAGIWSQNAMHHRVSSPSGEN